ncbi:MAG: DNA repair protein RecO [Bacilli bacterium]|nr:DNA repair protein RecO [Bacilli bacterium]
MIVITLSITQYKEKDAIVSAVSEDGFLTFLAKGVYDQKSANFVINNLLTVFDINLREGNYKYPILKSAKLLYSPIKKIDDICLLGSVSLILEMTNKLLEDEEKGQIYNDLSQLLNNFDDENDRYYRMLIYFAKILKISGYNFEVNCCINCHTKTNIFDFSTFDGGFLCKDCFKSNNRSGLTHQQMFLLRDAFNAKDVNSISQYNTSSDCLVLFNFFNLFINDNLGINLKSLSLLRK